jgi:hypothetical protein
MLQVQKYGTGLLQFLFLAFACNLVNPGPYLDLTSPTPLFGFPATVRILLHPRRYDLSPL